MVIGTSIMKAVAPRWPLLALAATLLGIVSACGVLMVAFSGVDTAVAADMNYQCDTAIGPDSSVTVTATAAATGGSVAIPPTANPYASLPDDGSPRMRACRNAMHSAPYQMPPLHSANTGLAVECAHTTAVALVDQALSGSGGGTNTADTAALLSLVTRWASMAALTGTCPAVRGVDLSAERGQSASRAVSPARGCPSLTMAAVIELPGTIAAQSLCGQRVDQAAASPGDLVFWQYDDYAPVRAGIAVTWPAPTNATTGSVVVANQAPAQMVTVDPVTGLVVQTALPTRGDVRIKRLLSSP